MSNAPTQNGARLEQQVRFSRFLRPIQVHWSHLGHYFKHFSPPMSLVSELFFAKIKIFHNQLSRLTGTKARGTCPTFA